MFLKLSNLKIVDWSRSRDTIAVFLRAHHFFDNSHYMQPKIPGDTFLDSSEPTLSETIKKSNLKTDYYNYKLEIVVELYFYHFFDQVTNIDGQFSTTRDPFALNSVGV